MAAPPTRVRDPRTARQLYGPLADRAFAGLMEGDPLADEAAFDAAPKWLDRAARAETPAGMPKSLRRLVDAMASPPSWVNYDRCDRAGRLLFRSSAAGGIVLGAKSLLGGYTSPAGNKPLAFSGQLEQSVQFRLAETGRFVVETCRRGGLRPGAPGWGITLRVRLMHARVRQLLLRDARWRTSDWGVPINQHDMVATSLLFSTVFVDGVRAFGVPVSAEEDADYIHLWRTSGWLMGVDASLQPTSRIECDRLHTLIESTQHPPDDDSRALTRALLHSPRLSQPDSIAQRHVELGEGFARALLGDAMADA
ncbi:MAG: oxygenase MpaB family protein, partial [Myxococcota bacterium]